MKKILGLMLLVSLSACAAKEKTDKGAAEARQAQEEAQAEVAEKAKAGVDVAGASSAATGMGPTGAGNKRAGLTGPDYMKQGWKQTTTCTGHEYKYLIEKAGQRKVCSGVSGFAGPVEYACEPFTGKVADFKKCVR